MFGNLFSFACLVCLVKYVTLDKFVWLFTVIGFDWCDYCVWMFAMVDYLFVLFMMAAYFVGAFVVVGNSVE